MKKLKRSSKNKVIAGIFGGLGEYMDVDPTILRLIGLLLFLVTGLIPFILVYIVAILIVPKTEEEIKRNAQEQVWRKWWFWIIILLIILSLLPIIAILAFRGFDPVANVNIHTEGQESREQVEEVVKEDRAPKKREVIKYLEEEIITPNYEGEIFADYYDFGRDANKLYLWAYISEYYLEDEKLKQGSGVSLPLAIEFEEEKVINHIEPRDGADYTEDVKRIFPSYIEEKVLNIQEQAVLSSDNEYQDLIDYLEKSVKKEAEESLKNNEE